MSSPATAMKGRSPAVTKGRSAAAAAAAAMSGASPASNLSLHLEHFTIQSFSGGPIEHYGLQPYPPELEIEKFALQSFPSNPPSRFEKLLESDGDDPPAALESEDVDCILSQDFFCTPDYITPEAPQISNVFDFNKEDACPNSPEKSIAARNKRHRQEEFTFANLPCHDLAAELQLDAFGSDQPGEGKSSRTESNKKSNYVSQSAVALRSRVLPPPCIKNPYLNSEPATDLEIFGNRKLQSSVFSPAIGGDGLSRYRTDFHEIEQIGCGNFSRVFKVMKRIDGCMYAVKCSIKQLHHDTERRRALMEVQALAALGYHENIVGYYTSWFENEQLYIQMELCDRSLSVNRGQLPKCTEILEVMYQIAKALQFMHGRGIAHLDVKPENIYVKNGVCKLGDFGCATLMDRSLRIEDGDSRYMPQEMLNEKYEHLDKVDIFSLGAATYELVKGSPLPDSGPQFSNLREGKIPLLPGYTMQFQGLLKAMMDPDPMKRPSAKDIIENPIFDKGRRTSTKQPHNGIPSR